MHSTDCDRQELDHITGIENIASCSAGPVATLSILHLSAVNKCLLSEALEGDILEEVKRTGVPKALQSMLRNAH